MKILRIIRCGRAIKEILKKIYDSEPSNYLIQLNLDGFDPYYDLPRGIIDFITFLISCTPILCVLQSILWEKQLEREARIDC